MNCRQLAAMLVVLLTPAAWSCGKGCYAWKDGCACDAPILDQAKPVVADDVRPRKSPQPEWETGEVKISPAASTQLADEKRDREIVKADAEGKRAAGIVVK